MSDVVSLNIEGDTIHVGDFTYLDLKIRLIDHLERFLKDRTYARRLLIKRVLPTFPISPEQIPCLIVRQTGDSVEKQAIGLDFGYEQTQDGTFDTEGAWWREAYELRYFADNAELRDAARPWLRAAIFDTFRTFDEIGAQLPQVNGGQDEEDFSEQAPQELYMVAYQVSYQVPVVRTHVWWQKALGVDATIQQHPTEYPIDAGFVNRIQSIGQPQ